MFKQLICITLIVCGAQAADSDCVMDIENRVTSSSYQLVSVESSSVSSDETGSYQLVSAESSSVSSDETGSYQLVSAESSSVSSDETGSYQLVSAESLSVSSDETGGAQGTANLESGEAWLSKKCSEAFLAVDEAVLDIARRGLARAIVLLQNVGCTFAEDHKVCVSEAAERLMRMTQAESAELMLTEVCLDGRKVYTIKDAKELLCAVETREAVVALKRVLKPVEVYLADLAFCRMEERT